MKNKILNVVFGLVFVAGLAIMLYPIVSDLINDYNQSQVIETYNQNVDDMSKKTYDQEFADARMYNSNIARYANINSAHFAQKSFPGKKYEDLLDVGGIGVMGVLEVPSVDISLPIYHGTDQSELQVGIGHYVGSSLPIGGKSTHCVLTGHRGLPSSRLLTDIDQLEKGDIFYVRVLKETLAYEVDSIKTVLPKEMDDINIVQGKDYCTLVTCTPYGINTHRLLVRGKRIAYIDLQGDLSKELAMLPLFLAILLAIIFYIIVVFLKNIIRKRG